MLITLKRALLVLLVFPIVACAEPARFQEGVHYVELPKAVSTGSSDKIEVLELFWYGCPHCYALEPTLNSWVDKKPSDVAFKRMPGLMARSWIDHGKAYYTAEALGVLDQTHEELFNAIHKFRKRISDQDSLAKFYASHGVDKDKFIKTFNSFSVKSKLNQALSKQKAYQASGVPAIIVNGKYRVSTTMAAGQNGMFEVINFLVEKERAAL